MELGLGSVKEIERVRGMAMGKRGGGAHALREGDAPELEVPDYLVEERLEGDCPGRGGFWSEKIPFVRTG